MKTSTLSLLITGLVPLALGINPQGMSFHMPMEHATTTIPSSVPTSFSHGATSVSTSQGFSTTTATATAYVVPRKDAEDVEEVHVKVARNITKPFINKPIKGIHHVKVARNITKPFINKPLKGIHHVYVARNVTNKPLKDTPHIHVARNITKPLKGTHHVHLARGDDFEAASFAVPTGKPATRPKGNGVGNAGAKPTGIRYVVRGNDFEDAAFAVPTGKSATRPKGNGVGKAAAQPTGFRRVTRSAKFLPLKNVERAAA